MVTSFNFCVTFNFNVSEIEARNKRQTLPISLFQSLRPSILLLLRSFLSRSAPICSSLPSTPPSDKRCQMKKDNEWTKTPATQAVKSVKYFFFISRFETRVFFVKPVWYPKGSLLWRESESSSVRDGVVNKGIAFVFKWCSGSVIP